MSVKRNSIKYIYNEVISNSVEAPDIRKHLKQYKKAANNGAICHNQKVNRLDDKSQTMWRGSIIQGQTVNRAIDIYSAKLKNMSSQSEMFLAYADLR
ncbi:MAG: hypothetical protein KZQ93_09330 [Candidatus Thiodiazotropha sp. (ex Monitilora ramsayi)]|nr:hypothetical protein [Candidatus Thiodiazotropha sp. (ex Monitilora ramsayi)]